MNEGGHPVGVLVGTATAWVLWVASNLIQDVTASNAAAIASLILSLVLLWETRSVKALLAAIKRLLRY